VTFKVTDLPVAAYISVRGLKFLGCERVSEREAAFVFDDPQKRGWELVAEYENDGECSARTFNRHFRILRAAVLRMVGRE
jgi:hypothetical protein